MVLGRSRKTQELPKENAPTSNQSRFHLVCCTEAHQLIISPGTRERKQAAIEMVLLSTVGSAKACYSNKIPNVFVAISYSSKQRVKNNPETT